MENNRSKFLEIINHYYDMDFTSEDIIDKLFLSEDFIKVFNSYNFYLDTEDMDLIKLYNEEKKGGD